MKDGKEETPILQSQPDANHREVTILKPFPTFSAALHFISTNAPNNSDQALPTCVPFQANAGLEHLRKVTLPGWSTQVLALNSLQTSCDRSLLKVAHGKKLVQPRDFLVHQKSKDDAVVFQGSTSNASSSQEKSDVQYFEPSLNPELSVQKLASQRHLFGKEASFYEGSAKKKQELTFRFKNPETPLGLQEKSKLKHLFKCPEKDCSYSSDDSFDFLLHITIHPKSTYHCVYCFREYSKANLIWHIIRVHGSEVYQCSLCYFRSSTRYFLKKHFKNAHPSKPCIFLLAKKVTLSNKEPSTLFPFSKMAKLEKVSLPKMESLAPKLYNAMTAHARKSPNEEIMTRSGKEKSRNCPENIDNPSLNSHKGANLNEIQPNRTMSKVSLATTHLSSKSNVILNQEDVKLASTPFSQPFDVNSSSTPPKFVHLTLQREGVGYDIIKSCKVSMQSFSPSCKKVIVSDNNDHTKNKNITSSPKCESFAGNHITMQPSSQSGDNASDDDDNQPLCKLVSLIKDVSPSEFSKGVQHSLISDKRNDQSSYDEVFIPKKGLRSKWQTPLPHHDGGQTPKHSNPLSGNESDPSDEPLRNLAFDQNQNGSSATTRESANNLYPDNSSLPNETETPLPHSEDKLSSPNKWSKLLVRLPTNPTCTIPFNSFVSVRNIYPELILKDIMKDIIS